MRVKKLDEESAKLKRMYAELALEISTMKNLIPKNGSVNCKTR